MVEYIFELNEALYNEETGEACFKPTIKGKLVRCKDCKYWGYVDYDEIANLKYGECNNPISAIKAGIFLNEKYYCPDGERRE